MPQVTYRQYDGAEQTCEVPAGHSVMDGALDNLVPGIRAQCGGAGICATCHCYVGAAWRERVPPPQPPEREMLDYVWEPRDGSRLACQIKVTAELDGLVIEFPERQI